MDGVAQLIGRYFEIWNERGQACRRELIAETWDDEGTLVGPLFRADGADGIDGIAAGLQEHFTAHEFGLVGTPSAHNDAVRFSWEIAPLSGEPPVAAGVDFGTLAPDGRIKSIVTFVDLFPAGADAHG